MSTRVAVHPHMRGEHRDAADANMLIIGSSPHAWGTRAIEGVCILRSRFIPTCVGNTPWHSAPCALAPVHPHMRGEHAWGLAQRARVIGSSPHAWGTHRGGNGEQEIRRFIPTCVGNTRIDAQSIPLLAVHPHMRGEHHGHLTPKVGVGGSSPHAWGTRKWCSIPAWGLRFIPTCVGNTQCSAGLGPSPSVHPHMRGEHSHRDVYYARYAGSSPHAWGTRRRTDRCATRRRFIPTCVGNTFA